MNIEENLAKLEKIAEKLSSGEVSLEESLELYKEGMMLSKDCKKALDKAELEVKKYDIE